MATVVEKIFSAKVGYQVKAGDIVVVDVDACMIHDVNGPAAIKYFDQIADTVRSAEHCLVALDHFAPCPNAAAADRHGHLRRFAKKHGIKLADVGKGVCHQVMLESGAIHPGAIAVGTDSHSCTYGVLNAFGVGISAAEAAVAFASDQCWFKVPQSIRVDFVGTMSENLMGKDLALEVMHLLGESGAAYQTVEFGGSAIGQISFEGRITLCNMMVEAGAKGAIMPCDEVTRSWMSEHGIADTEAIEPDADACYSRKIVIDVTDMEPLAAVPPYIDNTVPARTLRDIHIDQVVLGSCTNGCYEDMAVAAQILKGRKVADGVRLLVIPASLEVEAKLRSEGLLDVLAQAGACIFPPNCGPCAGLHCGLLGDEEVAVSTTNRNVNGRMGSKKSHVYVASPLVAAYSALCGVITDREV